MKIRCVFCLYLRAFFLEHLKQNFVKSQEGRGETGERGAGGQARSGIKTFCEI